MTAFLIVTVVAFLTVAVALIATALVANEQRRVVVIDVTWGAGFVAVALLSALTATVVDTGEVWRRWLLVLLVAIWGLRLAWHTGSRVRATTEEDPRYAEILGENWTWNLALRKVFLTQGAAMWFVSLPVQVGAVADGNFWPLAVLGVLVYAVGLYFEVVGDAQLRRYKAAEHRPPVMDRGLWAWTRHPNYFGDACVWWGIWLVASSAWPALFTVLSPIAMTLFLRNVTGARLLEKRMMQRPAYREYAQRVPMFFPRPPGRGAGADTQG